MSELEKAKQEVEQVCFAYDKAGGTGDIKDWKYFYDLENKLIEKVKRANQPSLTIPKSIADDKVVKYAVEHPNLARFVINDILEGLAIDEYPIDYKNVIKWIKPLVNVDRDKLNVIFAYLAGKALGVDLVKVGEG